jgi:SAM-dependent methyltransferase
MPIALPAQRPPIPPADLVQRVTPPFKADELEKALRSFDEEAVRSVRCLENGLAAIGRDLSDFERCLDFGCGPGRIMRWLGPLAEDVELHGVDIDGDAIAWAAEHIPYARFTVAPHEPPMAYPDGRFDLVINHSVFTHLDERMQDLWLGELRRVTRPGAVLLLSVHGPRHFHIAEERFRGGGEDPEPYRQRLESDGILFIAEDSYVGSTHPPFYHSTFHAPWYVFEHWHEFFHVRGYLPEGADVQDMVVLERRDDHAPVPVPIRRRAEAAAPAGAPASEPLEHARELHANWPAPRTALGRLKRRVLRGEIDRYDRLVAALIESQRQAEGRLEQSSNPRSVSVLSHALYQQGERISLVDRDLRNELEDLRARLAELERGR